MVRFCFSILARNVKCQEPFLLEMQSSNGRLGCMVPLFTEIKLSDPAYDHEEYPVSRIWCFESNGNKM
jgi:hypothetical protein